MEREQRRLAAILVADVVGYSKLVGSDEAGTLARLRALRADVIDPAIGRHSGRLFKSLGDGFLVEFASAVQAVACARAIQDANASGALKLRIGIHLGDVVVQGDDLLGDGVNIAARVEGVAEPGGIAISRAVHEQVRDKLELNFIDKGQVELKNIARPVRVFALGGAVLAAPPLALPDKPSIAVLPFQNMSGDPEQEYFVDGLVEDITTALSRFKQLFVIARNSAFTYKGRAVDIKQVGRELGVRYVLEGSVRKAGSRVRITGQLIEAATGAHLWADRFDGDLADIFELQDSVTTSVVGAMVPKLDSAELERTRRKPVDNLNAYDCVLRAKALRSPFGRDINRQIEDLANRAIELDPESATAYALVCRCIANIKLYRWDFEPARHEAEVRRLAERVRQFGQDDSYALAVIAFSLAWVCRDYDLAWSFAEKSVGVNPNDAYAWLLRGGVAAFCGDHGEALKSLERAARISPVGYDFHTAHGYMALSYLFLGDYPKALAAAATSIPYLPTWLVPFLARTAAEALMGNTASATNSLAQLRTLNPDLTVSTIGEIYPYRREEDVARLCEGLRKAGLPEGGQVPASAPLALPDKPSIAVLPFQNMSGDPEQEYFADGMVEEIITALSRDRGLFVIARNSTFTYKGRAVDIRQVGRELGVRYVLEGSVRKAAGRLRITAQLIDSESGAHLWADRFDGAVEDVFDLQDQVSAKVMAALAPSVERAEMDRSTRKTANLQAYDFFLRALAEYYKVTVQGIDSAQGFLQQSLALDSTFARSHALLAATYTYRVINSWSSDLSADAAAAERSARRAMELDNSDAFVLTQYGVVLAQLFSRREEARALYDRAIELNPNYAVAWSLRGMCQGNLGNTAQSISDLEQALRLSPLDAFRWLPQHVLAWGHLMAGRYDEAVSWATAALQLHPHMGNTLRVLIAAHGYAGRLDKAHEVLATHMSVEPDARLTTLRPSYLRRISPQAFENLAHGLRLAGFPE